MCNPGNIIVSSITQSQLVYGREGLHYFAHSVAGHEEEEHGAKRHLAQNIQNGVTRDLGKRQGGGDTIQILITTDNRKLTII